MKKTSKKLRLNIQTMKTLVDDTLGEVRGGRPKSQVVSCSCQGACNNVPAPPITEPI